MKETRKLKTVGTQGGGDAVKTLGQFYRGMWLHYGNMYFGIFRGINSLMMEPKEAHRSPLRYFIILFVVWNLKVGGWVPVNLWELPALHRSQYGNQYTVSTILFIHYICVNERDASRRLRFHYSKIFNVYSILVTVIYFLFLYEIIGQCTK